VKLTPSQTAKQAKSAITRKYGKVRVSEKYYHAGNGNWVRYSLSADRRKTAKGKRHLEDIEKNESKWMKHPHKYDIGNKDTARSKIAEKKKPIKKSVGIPSSKVIGGGTQIIISGQTYNLQKRGGVSKTQAAKNRIFVDYALHGKDTGDATRAYIENRISKQTYNEQAEKGLKAYQKSKRK
jgi:hypothetical protein